MTAIERDLGCRLGVAATGSGAAYAWRGDERFAMSSTFKFLLAGAALRRVEAGAEQLDRRILIAEDDLQSYAPVVSTRVGTEMTVDELCHAAITLSDNAAGNILLATMGGPEGFTAQLRAMGDAVTRLDRWETDLNTATPGDARDTTTPRAMLAAMDRLLLGAALLPASRDRLTAWLVANETGGARIRAGVPADWRVGDKTGTGGHGSVHDIAVLFPPGRSPILLAVYLTETDASVDLASAAHAAIASVVTDLV